ARGGGGDDRLGNSVHRQVSPILIWFQDVMPDLINSSLAPATVYASLLSTCNKGFGQTKNLRNLHNQVVRGG
ncbi:hypothetical protein ACCT09_23955, partial [Rhizobium ruizarguesonis]